MADNPFAKYVQQAPGPIIAPVDPYKQADEVRANNADARSQQSLEIQASNAAGQQTLTQLAIQERQDKLEQRQAAERARDQGEIDAAAQIRSVISQARQAKDLSNGWFATGFGSSTARDVGGTQAANVASLLNTIGANTAFDRLQQMRAQSPTGGALGAVSDTELQLLRDSTASLSQSQSDEQFRQNMDRVIASYQRVLDKLEKRNTVSPTEVARDENGQPIGGYDEQAGGLTGGNTDDSPVPPGTTPGGGPGSGERGGIMDLAQQGVTLGLADEAQGIGGYLSALITGGDPQAAYVRDRDDARRRVSEAREQYPIIGTGLELLAGGGATRIAGAAGNALRSVVGQGAALGGVGGYGYGEGNASVTNALAGAAGGAALGGALYGVGRGVGALASRRQGPSPTAEQLALVQAGEREGVSIRQPDVRPELRNQMANAETTQTGGPIIRDARAADVARIEQRVAEVGGDGAVADNYTLGGRVQDAGERYIVRTRDQKNRMYRRAEQAAEGRTVQPNEVVAAINNNIAELRATGETTNAGQIAYLEGLKSDFSKPLTIQAVQNLRKNMRGQLSERGLTRTDAERRVGQVIDAANADLIRELPQEASQALRAADTFYRERQTFINGTLKQFMGDRGNPLPAETAAQRLIAMTRGERGNQNRFASMWQQLEPDEQADIAATVAESLGRKRNGEFSAATLVGSLDPRKGINPRTARLIFGDEGAESLNNLRMIARAKSDTQASLNNSRTGTAVNAASGGLKNMMLGAFGLSQGGIGGAVALPIAGNIIRSLGEKRAARMLLNPDFTKWLRNAPNSSNPRVIDRYFSRLAGISSIPANDNQAFQAALREAASKSPGRAAASDQESD